MKAFKKLAAAAAAITFLLSLSILTADAAEAPKGYSYQVTLHAGNQGTIGLKDTPVVVACVLVLATMFTIINLCIDILYAFLDPRIRAQYKTAKR